MNTRLLVLVILLSLMLTFSGTISAAPPPPATPDHVALTLAASAPQLPNQAGKANVPGVPAGFVPGGLPGQPLLPQQTYHVALPPEADLATVQLEIVSQDTELLPGTHTIDPAPPLVSWVDGKRVEAWGEAAPYIVDGKDTRIYDKDTFFPAVPVSLIETGQLRKWRIAKISYTAQQFNPQTGQLVAVSNVRLRLRFDTLAQPPAQRTTELLDSAMDAEAGELLVNFADARQWYELPLERRQQAAEAATNPAYAIITTNEIVDVSTELSSFITHKETMGYEVILVTEDDYGPLTGPPPNGTAEKVRQWLQDNYLSRSILYVLLIGDPDPADPQRDNDRVGDLPMKMCYPRRGGYVSYRNPPQGSYQRGDVLQFDSYGFSYEERFDSSDFGADFDINGLQIRSDMAFSECYREHMLFALATAAEVRGLGLVSANDVVLFDPDYCENYGSGTFYIHLHGADVGLDGWNEEIDAVTISPDGRLVISTKGNAHVPGANGTVDAADEDLLLFDAVSGTWQLYFDGSSLPGMAEEDINGAWVDPQQGEIYVTLRDEFTVAGISGDGTTVLRIQPDGTTSIKWQLPGDYGPVNGLQLGGFHDIESPTDYLYADLTGSWDADGDAYACEYTLDQSAIDLYADVYTGRISVYKTYSDWVDRLDHILTKSMRYENETDRAWRRSAFLPMAFFDANSDGAYLGQRMMDDFLNPAGFSSYTMFQQETDTPCNSALTSNADLRHRNAAQHWAANPSGLMTWTGHGYGQGAVLYWGPCHGGDLFVSSQTSLLDDAHPAFTFHHSCSNGLVEVADNVASELLYQGAIGTMAASRISWGFVYDGWYPSSSRADDGSLAYFTMQALSADTPVAQALYHAKGSTSPVFDAYLMNLTDFNLLGDPSLSLDVMAHIHGTVREAGSDQPLAGVYVTAYRTDGSWAADATTDSAGRYDLGGVPAGTYRVGFVDGSGSHLSQYYDGAADFADAADIVVVEGATVGGIDAALLEGGRIRGRVTDEAGAPLSSIDISVYEQFASGWDPVAWATTAEDGTYEVKGLRSGIYRVRFTDYEYMFVTEYYDDAPDIETAADIPVAAGTTTPDINAALDTLGTISGRVTDENGAPLPHINVVAHQQRDEAWIESGYGYTDDTGRYQTAGLPPGVYRVEFRDHHEYVYAYEFYDDAPALAAAVDIEVASDPVTGIDAVLAPAGRISGMISDEAGVPLTDAEAIAYLNINGNWTAMASAYAGGAGYEIKGLSAGLYRVQFVDYGQNLAPEYYDDAPDIDTAVDIPVAAGTTTTSIDAALAAAEPPVNDEPPGLALDPLPFTDQRDVRGATVAFFDPTLPCGPDGEGYGSVWYSFTPTEDVWLSADTFGSNYDTVLAVWDPDWTAVACNDDASRLQSEVAEVPLAAGVTYQLEVAGYGSVLGDLVLHADAMPSPAEITVSGQVKLQGRATPATPGTITLVDSEGNYPDRSAAFDAETGAFTVPDLQVVAARGSTYRFEAAHDLYLTNTMTAVLTTAPYDAPLTTLKGGDANNDDIINLLDLACIGGSYGASTPGTCGGKGSADINNDNTINILDLAIAGGNYFLSSPQPW